MTMDDLTPVHPDWGNAYAAWTPTDIMGYYVDQELWGPAPPYGSAEIKFEYAGNAPTNTFGWYDPGTLTKTEIFSGPDGYLTGQKSFSPGGSPFGFYLGMPAATFYTEKSLNSGGTQQWVKVFNDPRGSSYGQILAWEDRTKPGLGPFTADSLTLHAPDEPDFNDMILRVTPTPELSTVLLLGLSLVAVPVVCRRRRRS